MWGDTRDVTGLGEGVMKWLVMLFNMVWRVGVAPDDRRKAKIIHIYKKGSRLECSNCRGISLLRVVGKVKQGC